MLRILAAAAALVAAAWPCRADTAWPNRQQGDVVLADFRFASGEVLPALKIHYRTVGTARRDGAGEIVNGVLLLHGTSGTSENWLQPALADELFAAGAPLDAEKFFIVIPDGIGRGGSSKPSDGLRMGFPHYRYVDMVVATHRLVTEHLGLKHLRLLLRTSMGGLPAWVLGGNDTDILDCPVADSKPAHSR